MRNGIKSLAIWLIIGVILIVAITSIIENSNSKMKYSELIENIEEGTVTSVDLSSSGASATVKLNDNTEKQVNIPSLDNNKMKIFMSKYYKQKQSSNNILKRNKLCSFIFCKC